jgi:squalene-hopene/tetraprenyl-beta-curcumene cyclase
MQGLKQSINNTEAHLNGLRKGSGPWEGHLSSSALSTATAIVALGAVDSLAHEVCIRAGVDWLIDHQNQDGGWGDTAISKSNLSTTLLCWSALKKHGSSCDENLNRCDAWILKQVGSVEPDALVRAVVTRYGKDKTFSVPILMHCAICGTLGENAWARVLPLPFELAAFPRAWFGAIGLPVVSYALPALIAIGHARFCQVPPAIWNPLRWLRALLWPGIRPMLKSLQPSSGGYLEATPLTSFVTMALASSGDADHPCVPGAVNFLKRSMRADGSWPIDTNLSTWGTTLAIKAQPLSLDPLLRGWLLGQQYREVHPFTNAAPGGWAWTDLPGGVPDADDTAGALIALWHPDEKSDLVRASEAGITWLLDLQNRDGGIPTFCRGWGTLPFDRSTPELTAHALLAWHLWEPVVGPKLRDRIRSATVIAIRYLKSQQRQNGSWVPLWFGNEHAKDEENPVYGTAMVTAYLSGSRALAEKAEALIASGVSYLLKTQKGDGSWGGDETAPSSIEETAVALTALCRTGASSAAREKAASWLISATREGTHFPPSPIGLYFARLWYHEQLYPVVWTLQALRSMSGGQ